MRLLLSVFTYFIISQTIVYQPALAGHSLDHIPVIKLSIKQNDVLVWVPSQHSDYIQGLKQISRTQLHGKGMLFSYPKQYIPAFTMKGTLTDIDLICLDAQGIIIEIIQMRRDSKKLYQPFVPCRFALELISGSVNKYQLKLGDRINLEKQNKKP